MNSGTQPDPPESPDAPAPPPPLADVRPARRSRVVWLIPAAAVVFALGLIAAYVVQYGPMITIRMSEGHGIKAGDVLRCRGIIVGQVESANLSEELDEVVLRVRLAPEAEGVARGGSRFWVVRPRLGLGGVAGLETIAGPRHLAVLPGDGPPQSHFIAMAQPPAVESIDPGGLEVMLIADSRDGLRPGAPVLYRQVPIGVVLSVGLASDAASIEARAYIRPSYAALVRETSRFWSTGGAEISLGLTGLSVEVESLEALVVGGVAMATPDPPGDIVSTGHRFTLHLEPEEDWLEWRPSLLVGTELLPPGLPQPVMLRATLRQTTGRFWKSDQQRSGWLLPTASGLLGPTNLLTSEDKNATLEVAGKRLELGEQPATDAGGLSLAKVSVDEVPLWPMERVRRMDEPEECLIFTDAATPPIPLAAARLQLGEGGWLVDRTVSFDPGLHGAAVVARADGALVGLLRVEDHQGRIVPIPDMDDNRPAP